MKAAAFSRHGGPEVLGLMDLPTPTAGPGQVRVQVKAAGVQPYDCAVRAGWTPPGIGPQLPKIPGNEFAGIVDQVGKGAPESLTGTEVLGFGQLNAYAEYIVIPADQVTAKPASMPWEVAGGFTAGAQTAHIAHEGEQRHSIVQRTQVVPACSSRLSASSSSRVGVVCMRFPSANNGRAWPAPPLGASSRVSGSSARAFRPLLLTRPAAGPCAGGSSRAEPDWLPSAGFRGTP